jgi:hypothetical protein
MSDLELEKKNKLKDMFDGGSGKGGVSKEIRDQITEQRHATRLTTGPRTWRKVSKS